MYNIVTQISAKSGLPEEAIQKTLDTLRELIVEQCSVGESVQIRGICTVQPIQFSRLEVGLQLTQGFTCKIKPSKTLVEAVQTTSLSEESRAKATENVVNMANAMAEAGIAVMEVPGLN